MDFLQSMSSNDIAVLFIFGLWLFVWRAYVWIQRIAPYEARLQAGDPDGTHVVDIWLDWEICTGSTMFRSAYATQARAVEAANYFAQLLDDRLPRTYSAEMCDGSKYREEYNFSIKWGIRQATEGERNHGVRRIWTSAMPGTTRHHGEHWMAHPFNDAKLSGDVTGFKL